MALVTVISGALSTFFVNIIEIKDHAIRIWLDFVS
jgi:hypothetical protein